MSSATVVSQNLRSLIGYIVNKHHVYLRQELPRLEAIIGKMSANHGQERPELFTIQQLLQDLRDDLSAHLMKEEQVLFPYVEGLEAAEETGAAVPHACFPTVRGPIRMMFIEHDRAQGVLQELRAATGNYNPPKGTTCECAQKFYQGLADLESDLLEHIRVENEELFPRAIELEERAAAWR
jgi:regulator of cell morphogenesis and NO signaling